MSTTWPPSLWAATAPAAPDTPPLAESIRCDVLVVGAGYTGLSTALHLAEAGAKVCVLDAQEPGWGASGRNGGQVNPTLKHDPEDLLRIYGPEAGERLIAAVNDSADVLFDLIARLRIDCQPVRKGWMQVGYSEAAVAGMHRRAEAWARRGVAATPLSRDEVARRMGSHVFAGGWLDGRAGAIQPLAYARGLARAAMAAGAAVHGQTAVTSLDRQGSRWVARTAGGAAVDADRVVLATNGYTGPLWPGLAQTVLAANSFLIATRPLTGEAAQRILAGGETGSTSQRLLIYFRRDATGRLLLGGRGHFADPTSPVDFRHLEQAMAVTWPELGTQLIDYRWAGRVAITRDFMPHVHEPAPGVSMALGYNGRGVAMATSMGMHLARRLTGAGSASSASTSSRPGDDFPFPITLIQPIPMHGWQRALITAGVAWYSVLDRLSR